MDLIPIEKLFGEKKGANHVARRLVVQAAGYLIGGEHLPAGAGIRRRY